jgi:hypothetical protein
MRTSNQRIRIDVCASSINKLLECRLNIIFSIVLKRVVNMFHVINFILLVHEEGSHWISSDTWRKLTAKWCCGINYELTFEDLAVDDR